MISNKEQQSMIPNEPLPINKAVSLNRMVKMKNTMAAIANKGIMEFNPSRYNIRNKEKYTKAEPVSF